MVFDAARGSWALRHSVAAIKLKLGCPEKRNRGDTSVSFKVIGFLSVLCCDPS